MRRLRVQELINKTKHYCLDSVNDWNSHAHKVTESLLLGVTGIHEQDAEGATAVTVELCSLFEMIKPSDDVRN